MIEQGTTEWFAERLGRCTASKFKDVIAGGDGKARKTYLISVVAERLTGKTQGSFSNSDTTRGIKLEPAAALSYEARTGNIVIPSGFIKTVGMLAGGSPDGLIDEDGGIEIKSVNPSVQIRTIEYAKHPKQHNAQIQGLMWITGRDWWDFVSYSPTLPKPLDLFVYRVERDGALIDVIARDVMKFLLDANDLVDKLTGVNHEQHS